MMTLDQIGFRNLFSLYPIFRFVCFESETERNPRMQFCGNQREGYAKIIRNIPVTTDKLIHEIVINSVNLNFRYIDDVLSLNKLMIWSIAPMQFSMISSIPQIQRILLHILTHTLTLTVRAR